MRENNTINPLKKHEEDMNRLFLDDINKSNEKHVDMSLIEVKNLLSKLVIELKIKNANF